MLVLTVSSVPALPSSPVASDSLDTVRVHRVGEATEQRPVEPRPFFSPRIDRDESERLGARTPFQLIGLVPGHAVVEAAGTVGIGAIAASGSFGVPALRVDGWEVRLPRLEGRGLSAMLLDRMGPHAGYSNLAALGALSVAGPLERPGNSRAVRDDDDSTLRLDTVDHASGDEARSRVAVYRGGFDATGGGATLADRRGPLEYHLGVMNASAGRSGGVQSLTTRLAVIDAVWHGARRFVEIGVRNGERDVLWKDASRWSQDNQGLRIAAGSGDTMAVEWRLQGAVLDDRLSGSRYPDIEYRRRGLRASCWGGLAGRSLWAGGRFERDRFALRSPTRGSRPVVSRGLLAAGVARSGPRGVWTVDLRGRIGERHAARWGGGVSWRGALATHRLTLTAGRLHRPPTLDQEVLAIEPAALEPERAQHAGLELESTGRWPWSIAIARRRLTHVPWIVAEENLLPWPLYRFAGRAQAHWEVRVGLATPPLPVWALRAGAWLHTLEPRDELDAAVAWSPRRHGRAFLTAEMVLLDGDVVLRPRADLLWTGTRTDFAGTRLAEELRIDGTLIAIMSEAMDLEIAIRNLNNRRTPLPVVDQTTGELFLDSGRMTILGLRWRLSG